MAREKDEVYTSQSIIDMFEEIGEQGDKRDPRGLRHPMYCILVIILLGFLSGCTSYREMYRFFHPRDSVQRAAILAQLQTFLPLDHGIPHYSTISRAMAKLDPDVLVTMVAELIRSLLPDKQENGEKIHFCLDGKAIRASENRARTGNNRYVVNVITAGYYLFTNQILVGPKKQEGKIIEENIIALLNGMQGHCTMDAMGTKKAILGLLLDLGCDATLPVKGNNETLKAGILKFIRGEVTGVPNLVEHFADLNKYSDEDTPATVILNTHCEVFAEDNRNVDDATPDVPEPVDALPLFDEFYSYADANAWQQLKLDPKNSQLSYVKVGSRMVKMVRAHGRLERREFELVTDPAAIETFLLKNNAFDGWNRFVSVGQVTRYRGERKRDTKTKKEVWEISVTRTPYISTCCPNVKEFADIIRSHWNIETWHGQVLDKVLNEDLCTTRTGYAPENMSCLRKLAADLVIVKMDKHHLDEGELSTKPDPDWKTLLDGFKACMESMGKNILSLRNLITRRIRSPFKKA